MNLKSIIHKFLFSVILSVSSTSSTTPIESSPPLLHIRKDACPGEYCSYSSWVASKPVIIYKSIKSKVSVDTVLEGDTIEAIKGEIHTKPVPVLVKNDYPIGDTDTIKAGETFYLLDFDSEGYYNIWYKGKELSTHAVDIYDKWGDLCSNCDTSITFGVLQYQYKSDWWVLIKTKHGKTGWAKSGYNFLRIE